MNGRDMRRYWCSCGAIVYGAATYAAHRAMLNGHGLRDHSIRTVLKPESEVPPPWEPPAPPTRRVVQ